MHQRLFKANRMLCFGGAALVFHPTVITARTHNQNTLVRAIICFLKSLKMCAIHFCILFKQNKNKQKKQIQCTCEWDFAKK